MFPPAEVTALTISKFSTRRCKMFKFLWSFSNALKSVQDWFDESLMQQNSKMIDLVKGYFFSFSLIWTFFWKLLKSIVKKVKPIVFRKVYKHTPSPNPSFSVVYQTTHHINLENVWENWKSQLPSRRGIWYINTPFCSVYRSLSNTQMTWNNFVRWQNPNKKPLPTVIILKKYSFFS